MTNLSISDLVAGLADVLDVNSTHAVAMADDLVYGEELDELLDD